MYRPPGLAGHNKRIFGPIKDPRPLLFRGIHLCQTFRHNCLTGGFYLPSAHDLARETGLLGCVKGGPTDRSTNPKHLEGLGID